MIPYASFLYFGLAGLYVLLPVLVARGIAPAACRKFCLVGATVVMLGLQYYPPFDAKAPGSLRQIWAVAFFFGLQYGLARALLAARSRAKTKWQGHVAVAAAILPLLVAKLGPGITGSSGGRSPVLGLAEFIGLSYATLKAVDVLVGIHDGLIKILPPGQYLAFLFFFPTVSSGPIDRYRRFSADWARGETGKEVWLQFDAAIHRLFTGFFYKFIVAYFINKYWLEKIPADVTLAHSISYMYGYSLYLFFDFAGYSAFAIAFGLMLGVRVPENFQRPFLSRSIKEFWTRWHITLSTWFRDFIYMRFLLMAFKKKWFQDKRHAAYAANFLTFGVMGFWHGTQMHYLIYGLYHACLITGHDVFAHWNRPSPDGPARIWGETLPWQIAGILVTSHAVMLGFLIFSGRPLW